MRPRWYGILIAGWMAGCASPASGRSQAVPDHFDDNLDLLMRSIAHPCGADADNDGDGKTDVHYTYTYDPLGRSQRDVGVDPTGTLYEQIDYTWDNAGHLTVQHDFLPSADTDDTVYVYDTLGRLIQYRDVFVDSDPTDDTETLNVRTTIDYTNFDELGHAAHGDELYEDLDLKTSQMMSRAYGHDDLGRRTSLDVRFASGDPFQSWQIAYDDDAHTVTTNLDEPVGLRGGPGFTLATVDTYDGDGHWLSSHSVETSLSGAGTSTFDTVTMWDGDRELGWMDTITTTLTSGSVFTNHDSMTFRYQCDRAQVATDPLPAGGLAPRVSSPRSAAALHWLRAGR